MMAAGEDCGLIDLGCEMGNWVNGIVANQLEQFAESVLEGAGKVITSLGTLWVYLPTPTLVSSGSASSITPGEHAADDNLSTILGYVMWIGAAIAIAALIWLGGLIAVAIQRGQGFSAISKLAWVLGGAVLVGGSASIGAGVMGALPSLTHDPGNAWSPSGPTLFVQSGLWWYTGGLVILSIIIGGVRMAWVQRAEPGQELVKSFFTFILVAGVGVGVSQLLITMTDGFSTWILDSSLECDLSFTGD